MNCGLLIPENPIFITTNVYSVEEHMGNPRKRPHRTRVVYSGCFSTFQARFPNGPNTHTLNFI